LNERKDRTKLGLTKYAAEAVEQAAESNGDPKLSRTVLDGAAPFESLTSEGSAEDIKHCGLNVSG